MKTKSNNSLLSTGIISAIAASLCCITPVLAFISGAGGIASSFSWLEPARPYLLGFTVLVLGFAWHQKLKPHNAKEIQCACEEDEKPPFMQTKKFLGIVTVFAFLMMAFPYYGHIFYPENKQRNVSIQTSNIQTIQLDIEGMTCSACDSHVIYAAEQVTGVIEATADHTVGKAEIKFDKSISTKEAIINSINASGYHVSNKKN